MIKVLITVRGGVVESVASTEDILYLVVDHDNIIEGDPIPTMEDFHPQDMIEDEQTMKEYLTELSE